MEWMFPNAMSKVTDFLYQGSQLPSGDEIWLKRKKVGAIVNATTNIPCHFEGQGILYCSVPVEDSPEDSAIMMSFLEESTTFIAQRIGEGTTVFVHCNAGISRSSTITLAYLMKYKQINLEAAYSLLQAARPIATPNEGFWGILQEWEAKYIPI